jgi:hypothetical protein
MTEREQAAIIADQWLDFKMNALTQMVPGDPDCDACVLARQFVRAAERALIFEEALTESLKLQCHYASLLNMHDGGQRQQFADPDAWIERLRQTGTIER